MGLPVLRALSLCTCCRHYPGAADGRSPRSKFTHPCQPSPIPLSGRPAHRPFRGLLGVHSRYGLHTRAVTVFRDTLSEGFSHFVTSIAAPVASGWSGCRVGFAPTGKRRLVTAHGECGPWRIQANVQLAPIPVVRVTAFEPPGSTKAVRKRSRANKAQNCFLYCPSSDRGDSAIRLYIDEIEEDFLRSD